MDIPGYSSYILSQSGATGAVLIRGQYLKPADQIVIDSMPAQPVDRAFIYVGDLCPLTINYIYLDVEGDEQSRTTYTNRGYDADADPETFTTRFGDSYSKASPAAPDGYTCSMPVVSGTLNDLSDLQIVDEEVKGRVVDVFYYAQAPEFSVDISWGAMTYTYDRGIWNPATHHYSGGTFSPSDENTNRITVTNNSTVGVNAAFSYQSVSPYESIGGYFTASGSSSATALSSIDMAKKASGGAGTVQNIWLWLTGSLSDSVSGTITGGRFTVTITGGG